MHKRVEIEVGDLYKSIPFDTIESLQHIVFVINC